MKFKIFTEDDVAAIETAVNAWLLTGTYYTYSQSFCQMNVGEVDECCCLQIFYLEK